MWTEAASGLPLSKEQGSAWCTSGGVSGLQEALPLGHVFSQPVWRRRPGVACSLVRRSPPVLSLHWGGSQGQKAYPSQAPCFARAAHLQSRATESHEIEAP